MTKCVVIKSGVIKKNKYEYKPNGEPTVHEFSIHLIEPRKDVWTIDNHGYTRTVTLKGLELRYCPFKCVNVLLNAFTIEEQASNDFLWKLMLKLVLRGDKYK